MPSSPPTGTWSAPHRRPEETEERVVGDELRLRLDAPGALEGFTRMGATDRAATIARELGRATWVEEVWVNYISNAIKYGGSPPRIELGTSADRNGRSRFFVRDDGSGLTEAQRAQLFQEFQRFVPEQVEGHGLGLSIVRRLVEGLGGTVGAEGAPGQGSTFWFTLPTTGT